MFPWLFFFHPRYSLIFSPRLNINTSYERLWDSLIQVVDQNIRLTRTNVEIAMIFGESTLLASDLIHQLQHARGLNDPEVAKLKQRFDTLMKTRPTL